MITYIDHTSPVEHEDVCQNFDQKDVSPLLYGESSVISYKWRFISGP
jgi:hypothetical protein